MASDTKLELNAVLDGLGQGVLIFSSDGRLIKDNLAARTFLGATDFSMIKEQGWLAASTLFNTQQTNPDNMIDAVRNRALQSERPIRFYIFHSGEYTPCWATAIQTGKDGDVNTMITIENPDWNATSIILDKFREEMQDAISSTQGHIDIINKTIQHHDPQEGVEGLSRRIGGFTRLISVHMYRVGRLNTMLERLENIRTGRIKDIIRERRHKIKLENFFEDFIEELDEITLVDPETDARDHRSRIKSDVSDVAVLASAGYLTRILHDLLRNAIMYSMRGTPIKITVRQLDAKVQIDLNDEGYGIREKERERVFEEFKRARQPQIIGEFGYGLSLYLCKHEVEIMNGTMWFDSTENVGTTFSFTLPIWKDDASSGSSSSASTKSNPTTA